MTFTEKELNDIINDIIINILENTDEITDANVGSVMRQFVEALSQELVEIYDEINNVYDGSRISTATSTDLDELGYLVGINRKSGTQATGYVTFERNTVSLSDFTISAGAIISTQPKYERIIWGVKNGFQKRFNLEFLEGQLTPQETNEAQKLIKKYQKIRRKTK